MGKPVPCMMRRSTIARGKNGFLRTFDTGLPQNLRRTRGKRNVTVSAIVSIPGNRNICIRRSLNAPPKKSGTENSVPDFIMF